MTIFSDDEGLKLGIKGLVFMFKSLWDEVDDQFSDMSKSEKFRLFEAISPLISDMIFALPEWEEEEVEPPKSQKGGKSSKKR
jgi:hypothetical protein